MKRVYIEITNQCQLQCPFCAQKNRTNAALSLSQFEHILQEVKSFCDYIYLHVLGEPLLHPHFNEILEISKQYTMKIQLVTNGVLLLDHLDILSSSAIRKISISLHSLDAQSKEALETYKELVTKLILQEDIQPFIELRFWRDLKEGTNSFELYQFITNNYTLTETKKKNSYQLANHVYLSFDEGFEWPNIKYAPKYTNGHCLGGKQQLAILVDGTVVPCCLDADGVMNLGNILNTSLSNILNSDRYLNLIKGFNENKLVEPLCQTCSYQCRFKTE